MILNIIHTILCVGLLWTCFCRLVHTNNETIPAIRFAFFALGSTALVAAAAPWVWEYEAGWPALIITLATLVMQIITSRFWRQGVPHRLQRPRCC